MRTLTKSTALATSLALALGACGGSDKPETAKSKPAYIKKADGICNMAARTLLPLQQRLVTVNQRARQLGPKKYFTTVEPEFGHLREASAKFYGDLKAVPAPDEDRPALNEYLGSLKANVDALGATQDALKKQDVMGLQAATAKIPEQTTRARNAAKRYGFKSCAQSDRAAASE